MVNDEWLMVKKSDFFQKSDFLNLE